MPAATLQLKPAAAEILRSDAQVKVVFSGRRFGKTRLMLTAGIEECLSNPGSKVFYLAPSRKQAKDIAFGDLKTMVPESWLDRTYIANWRCTSATAQSSSLLAPTTPMDCEDRQRI